MKLSFHTRNKPVQIELVFKVKNPKVIRVVAFDSNFPKTILFDRTAYTESKENVLIKMPLSPKVCTVLINDIANLEDNSITVNSSKKSRLKRELSENEIHDPFFREFVKFIEKFAYNANYLETGKIYTSEHSHYAIQYLETIISSDGKPLTTPAMIREDSGFMKFAKSRINSFTVPGIIAIGLHEFSHNFLNENPDNEEEADLNSLITYLGLGFPLVEAYKAWENIYQFTNTPQNEARSSKVTDLLLKYSQEFGYNA